MGSGHLLRQVTATGPAQADPAAYKVRPLTGNGDFQPTLKSTVTPCLKEPHYHLRNRATRWQLFLPPADTGSRTQVFLLWN